MSNPPKFVTSFWAALAVLWSAAPAFPQDQSPAPGNIKVAVSEVIVPVTVTDDKNKFVTNLEAKDFHIFDNGKEQKIEFFSRDQNQPVVVGFLLDLSNANRLHWKNFQDAAMELAWHLLPGDKKFSGYLITYGNEAELAVNTTNDGERIGDRIRKLKPGGGAALYDAIYMACTRRELVKGEPYEPRRVIIIIGDGHDNASTHTLDQVIELAQRNLVTIFGMSTTAFGFTSPEGQDSLDRLTSETGGKIEYPLQGLYKDVSGYLSKPSDEGNYAYTVGTGGYASEIAQGLFKAVASISGEVTTQYILRYQPDVGPGTDKKQFRTIKVAVDLPNVKIRFRKGYYPYAP